MALTKVDISMLEDVGGANKLVKLDSNAKIPAGSGTGLSVKPGPVTSASDPTVSSNKTLGTEWLNSASGEMYVCTVATAGENVWTNVGEGTGDIAPYWWAGTQYGYVMGGYGGSPLARLNNITRFSFASGTQNATDGGNLTVGRSAAGSAKSSTHAYTAGGVNGGYGNIIDRVPFANFSANATDVGDLTHVTAPMGGHGTSTYGYTSGGYSNAPGYGREDSIDKYQLVASANATDVGNLTQAVSNGATATSSTHGYDMGGYDAGTKFNIINKFSFSTDGNSTDVGDLTVGTEGAMGVSSSTYGYACGGLKPSESTNYEKFSFASGTQNGSIVGTLTVARKYHGQGNQSGTHGYCNGGQSSANSNAPENVIDKFAFASDGAASDVGDLVVNESDGGAVSY